MCRRTQIILGWQILKVRMQIEITDSSVIYTSPEGAPRTIQRDALRAVLIETTDQGPFAEDVWWILIDGEGHCTIPQAVAGEALLTWVQQLPGFDNDAVIAAMGSTENQLFVCWQHQQDA